MQRPGPWLPMWVRTYRREWLRADVLAGVTVLAYLVPQVLAYAGIVGLPPESGLVTAVVALLAYAWIGSSPVLSVGPEATVALMAGLVLTPLVSAHPGHAPALAASLTVLVGLWLLVGRALRIGVIAHLLTKPILTGYLTGEAVLMLASQLGHATRAESAGATVPEQLASFVGHLDDVHWPTVAIAAFTFAVLLILTRLAPRLPSPLLAVVAATCVSLAWSGSDRGIRVLGAIPSELPRATLPWFDAATIGTLVIGSLGIALLAFSDVMLVARAFTASGQEVDANRELLGLAAVHLAAGVAGGFPSSASSSRTALGRGAGQRTQLAGVVTALGVVLVALIANAVLAPMPQAALAGLVIWAAVRLIAVDDYIRLWRFRRAEFSIAVLTALGTAVLGILPGIGIAVALSAVQILVALSRPHEAVMGFAVGVPGLHDVDDFAEHVVVPGLLIYRYDGPLLAYNRDDFAMRLSRAVHTYEPRWVVLNVEANMFVDFSACEALESMIRSLQREGRVVALARLKHDLRVQLAAAGIMELIGDRWYDTLPAAIKAYHAANPDVALPPVPRPGEPFDPEGPSELD